MRIVVSEFMSLDGVVQAPGGPDEDRDGGFAHGGWSFPYFDVDVMGAAVSESLEHTSALLYGRRTWTTMAAAWPDRAGDSTADFFNAVQKYVVSSTLTEAGVAHWAPTTILRPDRLVDEIASLKNAPGNDALIWGSPTLVRSLLALRMVDELLLMIEPITLGGGKSVFPDDGVARNFALRSVTQAATGVLLCRYVPA